MERRGGKFSKDVLSLQDNAALHKLHVAMQTIHDLIFELLEHPSYISVLYLSNYQIFPQLKKTLKVRTLSWSEEMMQTWFAEEDKMFLVKSRGVAGSLYQMHTAKKICSVIKRFEFQMLFSSTVG